MDITVYPLSIGGQVRYAFRDFKDAAAHYEVWSALSWMEIKQRYRRSLLGPLWITLTTLVTIVGMGPLYSVLLRLDIRDFVPYLALGIITWGLLSSTITDGCNALVGSDRLIRSMRLPFFMHVFRSILNNLIVFLHNLLALVPVVIYCGMIPQWRWLLAIPGVLLIALAALPASMILGMLCARFRDMQPIVGSVVQLSFFLTPVMWKPELLGDRMYVAKFNPLFLFMDAVRGPIYGYVPSQRTYLGIAIVIGILCLMAVPLFSRYRQRIAFWV